MSENSVPSRTPTSVRIDTSSRTDRASELPFLRAQLTDSVQQIGLRAFIRETLKFPNASYDLVQHAPEPPGSTSVWEDALRDVGNVPLGNEHLYTHLIGLYDWTCGWLHRTTPLLNANNLSFVDTHTAQLGDSHKPDLTGTWAGATAPGLTPSWKDILLMGYCLETITAQPHRRHTFGILLCNWQLQLVYHCRSFVLVSEAFDMRHDTLKFGIMIAALRAADLKTLGFDHRFVDAGGRTAILSQGSLVQIQDKRFEIEHVLYHARGLLGRGSALFSALSLDNQKTVALKLSCPPASRELESDLLQRASNIPNIIQVICSEVWEDTVAGFTPELVELLARFELRQFRILTLSPVCVPFTQIADLEVFKSSFVKLVIAHKRLFDIGILHCDISIGNIMYDPVTGEPYLIDADLGKSVDNLGTPSSNHRTGTLPFMATDLLVKLPPPHKYRHDLESFFHVLMWMIVRGHCGWDKVDSVATMYDKKFGFFGLVTTPESKIGQLEFLPMFEPLRLSWALKLFTLFLRGRTALAVAALSVGSGFDAETQGGHIT